MSENSKTVLNLNSNNTDTSSKIEVIKNLIFGESIEEFDSEFELMRRDILEKKHALETLIEEVRVDLAKTIDDVSIDLNKRITEVESKIVTYEKQEVNRVDKKTLGKMLTDLGKKLGE